MTAFRHNGLAMAAMAAVLAVHAAAQSATSDQAASTGKTVIVVSLEDRKLALVEDGKVKKIYTVAVGKPSTPSPVGTFTIERRVKNPTYSHDGRIVPPGPRNPVGTRWMGLSVRGYGIHGTNAPGSIGKAVSHGCIRMAKADLEELYPQVAVGDTVELIGERNEETAQLFGGTENPSAATQPATELARTNPASAPASHSAGEPVIASTAAAKAGSAPASAAAVVGAL
ncbi:MAG: L,D-transpeptidase [Terracidiphilus sp.]